MLITTSRKPSQRTRIFCRGLERTLNARSVNRGKMSLRDVFLKAKGMEADWVLVVTERDGNPSGMEVYQDGELFTSLQLTADLDGSRGKKERVKMKKDKLHLRCEVDELTDLVHKIFSIPLEDPRNPSDSNLLRISFNKQKSRPLLEFFDDNAQVTGPRIYLQEWKLAGDQG
jgi:U3 small nucleolar ribonucleoprotein protein IMP4